MQPAGAAFLRIDRHGELLVNVVAIPNASKTQPAGIRLESGREALRLQLTTPPVDGKANHALIEWFADLTGLPRAAIKVAHGETSRRKQLKLCAATAALTTWDAQINKLLHLTP